MKIKDFALRFLISFTAGFIATVLVTLIWNYLIKGSGLIVDWETSFRMAFVFGIVIPFTQISKK